MEGVRVSPSVGEGVSVWEVVVVGLAGCAVSMAAMVLVHLGLVWGGGADGQVAGRDTRDHLPEQEDDPCCNHQPDHGSQQAEPDGGAIRDCHSDCQLVLYLQAVCQDACNLPGCLRAGCLAACFGCQLALLWVSDPCL